MAKLRIEQGGETEEFQEQVFTADKAGERLDVFCARVSDNTRSAVQRMIINGDVTLNGAPAKSKDKLRTGDAVIMAFRPPEEVDIVPQDIPIDIVYEDADIAVIDKPKGMVVHPAPGNPNGTLVNALMYHLEGLSGIGGEIRPGIVHRIDKLTSGLVVVAKNDMAHTSLAAQMKNHSARRTYIAIVDGNIREDSGTVDAPIGRHPRCRCPPLCCRGAGRSQCRDSLAGAGEIRRVYAYRGEAGDRPHTPDKGTHGIHKAPRIWGYDIRRGKAEAGP